MGVGEAQDEGVVLREAGAVQADAEFVLRGVRGGVTFCWWGLRVGEGRGAYGAEGSLEFLVFRDGLVDGVGVGSGLGVGVGVGVLGSAPGGGLVGGQDGVFARVPDQQAACGVGGGFDEVVLKAGVVNSSFHETDSVWCRRTAGLTQKLCTLVSIAILPIRTEFASPGTPNGIAKLIELDCENCSRRS